MQYVISLGLTLLLEGALALAWGIRGRDLLLVALVNCLTNPLVVLVHNLAPGLMLGTVLPELWAVVTECWFYRTRETDIRRPVLFGISANVFSYFTGVLLNWIL